MDFYHLLEIYLMNKKKSVAGYRTRCFKNCFHKIVNKEANATDEFIGNKTADKIVKQIPAIDEN